MIHEGDFFGFGEEEEEERPEVTIIIRCHLCGRRFKATVDEEELEGYIWMEGNTYSGINMDHWCDECERDDQRQITKDWGG